MENIQHKQSRLTPKLRLLNLAGRLPYGLVSRLLYLFVGNPSKKTTGFSFAVLLLFSSAWVANAQDVQNRPATPQATPKQPDTIKYERATCDQQLSHCRSILKTRNEQIQAWEQEALGLAEEIVRLQGEARNQSEEIAKLRPQAALPICAGGSRGVQWLHPTLPPVSCLPYVCDATPFSCKHTCNSKLDCADYLNLTCTTRGHCEKVPKQKSPD